MLSIIRRGRTGAGLLASLILAGCTASALPPPTLTESPLNGGYTRGTIVAVRDADAGAGVAGVLAALNEPSRTAPGAQELVIRRADRSVTSLVQAPPPGEPPFRAGENVAIITASDTIVRRE
jgi:hypothetical protein